jgi:DNA-binding transcriptional LysR family regulator
MRWNDQIGRRLKLRDLHYLLAVVQAGSMAKAAALLSVTQPVVSKIIADMEHMLGVRLLDRSPGGVEPTIYGRRLLASGYAVFDELRQGVIEIEHLSDPAAGELSIGSNEASTLGLVPTVIAKIRRKHPRFFIQVIVANTAAEQRRELSERKIEFAIGRVWAPASDRDFEAEVLFEQRYFVVAGAHNPWTRRSRVELAELIEGPWVMPSLAGVAGQIVAEVFRASGLEVPRSNVVTSSFQLNYRLLEDGPFLAFLPASVLPSLTKNSSLRIVPVSLPDQSSPVGITKRRNRRLSPVAEIFIDAARSVARSMPSPDGKVAVTKRK